MNKKLNLKNSCKILAATQMHILHWKSCCCVIKAGEKLKIYFCVGFLLLTKHFTSSCHLHGSVYVFLTFFYQHSSFNINVMKQCNTTGETLQHVRVVHC